MKKVVKAGDRIQEAITATWFNEINKSRNILPPAQHQFIPENPVKVGCIADTGVDLARFAAANIVGPAIPYEAIGDSALQYSSSTVKVNSTLVANKWGIVQGPCYPEHSSELIVLGVTWAIFTYTSGHTHVDVVSGALTSGTSGKAIILSAPESSGKPGLILIRGAGEPRIKLRVSGLTFQISYDNEATWETWATGGECP